MRTMPRNASPILPIGTVNITTGRNKLFGEIWNGWEEDATASNILFETSDCPEPAQHHPENPGRRAYLAVHTCGDSSLQPGETRNLYHDQTFRDMGAWRVVGVFPHTRDGLKNLGATAGKKNIKFATYK